MARYIYIGKCNDGKYWLIQGRWIKYVEVVRDSKGRTRRVMRNYAKFDHIITNPELLEKLPREVKEVVTKIIEREYTRQIANIRPVEKCEEHEDKHEEDTKHEFVYIRDKIEHLFVKKLYGMLEIKPPEPSSPKINSDKVIENIGRDLLRKFAELDCSRFFTDDGTVIYTGDRDPCAHDPKSELCKMFMLCKEINSSVEYDIEMKDGKYVPKVTKLKIKLPNKNVVLYITREKCRSGETFYETKIATLEELYDEAMKRIMWQELVIRDSIVIVFNVLNQLAKEGKVDNKTVDFVKTAIKFTYASFLEFFKKMREFIIALIFNIQGKIPIIDHKPLDEYILTVDMYDNDKFFKLISCEIIENDEQYVQLIKYVMSEDLHEVRIGGVEAKLKKFLTRHRQRLGKTETTKNMHNNGNGSVNGYVQHRNGFINRVD